MNKRVVVTHQRVSNPDWLVLNGAENRLQIDFETSREIGFEIDMKSTLMPILNYPIGTEQCAHPIHSFHLDK
jgi:hypothetical protein